MTSTKYGVFKICRKIKRFTGRSCYYKNVVFLLFEFVHNTHAYFLVLTYNLPSFPTLSGPSVGFINPWTGEEIPGIPGEADDDDSMHGKIARILNVVFGLKIIIYVSDNVIPYTVS